MPPAFDENDARDSALCPKSTKYAQSTMLLGIAGSVVAGYLGRAVGWVAISENVNISWTSSGRAFAATTPLIPESA